jgi:hypothetical protein
MKTIYDFPPCRPHEMENGDFISLATASLYFLQRQNSIYGQSLLATETQPVQAARPFSLPLPSDQIGQTYPPESCFSTKCVSWLSTNRLPWKYSSTRPICRSGRSSWKVRPVPPTNEGIRLVNPHDRYLPSEGTHHPVRHSNLAPEHNQARTRLPQHAYCRLESQYPHLRNSQASS